MSLLLDVLVLLLVTTVPAHAYLDPGSGNMLLQMILGAAAGLWVVIRLTWKRILTRLGLKKPEDE